MQVQQKVPIDYVTQCPPTFAIMEPLAISNIDVSQSAATKQTDYSDGFMIIVIALIYWIFMMADNFVDYEEEWWLFWSPGEDFWSLTCRREKDLASHHWAGTLTIIETSLRTFMFALNRLNADRERWAIFNQAGLLFGWWLDSKQCGESSSIVTLFYLTFLFVMHTDGIISFSDGEKSENSKVLYKYTSAWAFSNGLTLIFGKSTNIHIQNIFFWNKQPHKTRKIEFCIDTRVNKRTSFHIHNMTKTGL